MRGSFISTFLTSGQIVTGNTKVFVCTGDGTIRTFKEEGGGSSVPVINKDFTYTGECQVLDDTDDEGVKWRIKFLTSGTFIPLSDMTIDVFLVGGGGYTKTIKYIMLTANTEYPIIIGAGGDGYTGPNVYQGTNGGESSAFNQSVNGGNGGSETRGGDGGSGGGGGFSGGTYGMLSRYEYSCVGGSDGGNGVQYTNFSGSDRYAPYQLSAGTGQGTTTREFGEPTGELYAGGGGGMIYNEGSNFGDTSAICNGGDGGGASGYNKTDATNGLKYAVENKGGGGGGTNNIKAPNFPKIDLGGSGIVVIRNTRS